MPACTQKMRKQLVLCSNIILQYKIYQINLTATELSKNNFLNKHHTFKEYVTNIDFLARPGPNVPYVFRFKNSQRNLY
jgi:hypothetical protein